MYSPWLFGLGMAYFFVNFSNSEELFYVYYVLFIFRKHHSRPGVNPWWSKLIGFIAEFLVELGFEQALHLKIIKLRKFRAWISRKYVNTVNIIMLKCKNLIEKIAGMVAPSKSRSGSFISLGMGVQTREYTLINKMKVHDSWTSLRILFIFLNLFEIYSWIRLLNWFSVKVRIKIFISFLIFKTSILKFKLILFYKMSTLFYISFELLISFRKF